MSERRSHHSLQARSDPPDAKFACVKIVTDCGPQGDQKKNPVTHSGYQGVQRVSPDGADVLPTSC